MGPVDKAWSIVSNGGQAVDAETLLAAISDPAVLHTDDPRTKLLVRDAVAGLRDFWGRTAFENRIRTLPQRAAIESVFINPPGDIGFPSLRTRLMNVTDPHVLIPMCRELGGRLQMPASITIGGSLSLMLAALIVRHTEDVDVVDELPEPIRREHSTLDAMVARYGLKLTHFQSHYLPAGWDQRTWSLGTFDRLTVRVIDPIDVLTGKLFSRREKDLDDLRFAWPKVDQAVLRDRIARSTAAFRSDAKLLAAAEQNWYIVIGERTLPLAV